MRRTEKWRQSKMATDKDLLDSINALVQEKTLSLEAMRGLSDIKERGQRLAKLCEEQLKQIEDYRKLHVENNSQISKLNENLAQWKAREDILLKREKEAEKAIAEAELHKAVADAYKDSFTRVFAPNMIREQIHKTIPVSIHGGAQGSGWVDNRQVSESVTREEGR